MVWAQSNIASLMNQSLLSSKLKSQVQIHSKLIIIMAQLVFLSVSRHWYCKDPSYILSLYFGIIITMCCLRSVNSYPDWLVTVLRRWQTAARWRSSLPSCLCVLCRRAGCGFVERCRALLLCLLLVSGWSPVGRRKNATMTPALDFCFHSKSYT